MPTETTPKRIRDRRYMAQKAREWRARQRAMRTDWPTYRAVLHGQATSLPFCPCPNCTRAA